MLQLKENWLTEGAIDFEYKKYILLAYLQSVGKNFTSNRLYPYLSDLIGHYHNLLKLINNKEAASQNFPKRLNNIDLQNFILAYEETVRDDGIMLEIEKILDFSIPAMRKYLEEGKEIYDWIEAQLQLRPVGITPVQLYCGYLFLRNGDDRKMQVFLYQLSIFEKADEKYRGVMTQYVSTYTTSITRTYEYIKQRIIEKERLLVPPAVYVVESKFKLPFTETLLPLAKRVLVRYLAENEIKKG